MKIILIILAILITTSSKSFSLDYAKSVNTNITYEDGTTGRAEFEGFFGETNPIIDNKINKIEKRYVSDFKKQLRKTKDKHEQEELLELIKLYEKPLVSVEKKVEQEVTPTVVEEKVVNQLKLNLNNHLFLRQNLIEKITVDMFIGAIHLNPLIRANLAALRIGELINQKGLIIKCKFSLLNAKVVL